MLNRSTVELGKIFFFILSLIFVFEMSLAMTSSDDTDGFVIIEKAPKQSAYAPCNCPDENLGNPIVKKYASHWGVSYMNKEFTNVTDVTENVGSTFYGIIYGKQYNWSWMSLGIDAGLYFGGKTETLAGEESNAALKSALSNQIVGDIGGNLIVNLVENYYLRPYVGAGVYVNQYQYVSATDSTVEESFNINSSFVRAGVLIDIGGIDRLSSQNLWREWGIFRTQLQIEAKRYTPVDSVNEASFEIATSFVFDY